MEDKRNAFSQLPGSSELQGILDAEEARSISKEKENVHYFDFSSLIALARHFGIAADVIERTYSAEDIASADLLEQGKECISAVKAKILGRELTEADIQVLNGAYDYLAEEDALDQADIIFVFGAKTSLRIEKAIDLYKQNCAKTIMVSGRGPFYGKSDVTTEAAIYAQAARDSGVSDSAILIEDKSITIPDNVRCSLNLLDKKGVRVGSVILVNSPYTQRRGWAHFRKYTPDSVRLIRINSGTGDQYKRDEWFRNPAGIDAVLSEYFKAKVAVSLNTA